MTRPLFVILTSAVMWVLFPAILEPGGGARADPLAAKAFRPPPEHATGWQDKPPVQARRFMAVAAHPLATEAGVEMLQKGGTAMDAAVAIQLVLGLVEPQSSGIGGGGFMVYWHAKTEELHSLDGRETAPSSARPNRFVGPDGEQTPFFDAVKGGQSVGVPGMIRMLEAGHRRFGKLPWPDLFEPAIRLAEDGFPISPRMAKSMARSAERGLGDFAPGRAYFFDATGEPRREGTLLKNPAYAETLRLIARTGAAGFYEGWLARRMVEVIRDTSSTPNTPSLEDFQAYRAKWREPVCFAYRIYQVCGSGAPTSGVLTVGQILGLLEGEDLKALGYTPALVHRYAEAAKLAFADRARYLADPDFHPVPAGYLDKAYLKARAEGIDPARAAGAVAAGEPPGADAAGLSPSLNLDRPGTTHFVVRDGDGNALSMTTSIETAFGSRVMAGGFLLNNELTDFDFLPEKDGRPVANRVEGGKRPRSSMAPVIVFKDGQPVLLAGSPGGSSIINYVAKTLIGILDLGLPLDQAIALGNISQRGGDKLVLEDRPDTGAMAAALRTLGHDVDVRGLNSGIHVIRIGPEGRLTGAADPRREGVVLGE